jgi:hypothetical protein
MTTLPVPVIVFDASCLLPFENTGNDAVNPLTVISAAPMVPVSVGLALMTTLPVPVIVLLTRPFDPSENTGSDAVNVEQIGCAVSVVTPVTASAGITATVPVP